MTILSALAVLAFLIAVAMSVTGHAFLYHVCCIIANFCLMSAISSEAKLRKRVKELENEMATLKKEVTG